jgi:CRP/FNR family transcriptional regulator
VAIPYKEDRCLICKSKSSCFTQLKVDELGLVDNNRLEVNYKKDELICKQGSFATHILFLKKGLVKVYLEGKSKNHILSITSKGNLIGLPSLFGDPIFHYSVLAYEDSAVCHIDINVFRKFIHENALFSAEIIKLINENTINNYERFLSVTQKNMPGRFADVLLYFSEQIYKSTSFSLTLSRKDLAEFSSMSIESLSRTIKDFNDNKIISVKGKSFEIIDKARLTEISFHG